MDATTLLITVDWLISFDPAVSILDSFPIPVCRFGRADRCRRLAELASFGRDEGAKQTYYGLRAHLRVCWPGVTRRLASVVTLATQAPQPHPGRLPLPTDRPWLARFAGLLTS